MNGMIVRIDKDITGLLDEKEKKPFPSPGEISDMKDNSQLFFMPPNGLMCSSVMPYLPVHSENLPHSVDLIKNNRNIYVQQKNFYTITIIPKYEEPSKSIITFYIRNKNLADTYTLKYKSFEYVLKPTKKILQMDGEIGNFSKDIKIYQGIFPTKEMKLTGLFLTIYSGITKKPIFDCFSSSNYQGVDVKNLFLASIAISEEQRMYKNLILEHEYHQTWSYFFISLFTHPIFLIIMVGLLCFGIFVIIKKNIKSDETKEMLDPLEDVGNHKDVIREVQ
jgi:hypothetical protein